MNRNRQVSRQTTETIPAGIVEPLADYICAAALPHSALTSVWETLMQQVEQTNQSARASVAAFRESCCSLPA